MKAFSPQKFNRYYCIFFISGLIWMTLQSCSQESEKNLTSKTLTYPKKSIQLPKDKANRVISKNPKRNSY